MLGFHIPKFCDTHLLSSWRCSEEQVIRCVLPADDSFLTPGHPSHRGNFSWKSYPNYIAHEYPSSTYVLPWG